jgi:glycerol-3-phosphate O-acyltransferase
MKVGQRVRFKSTSAARYWKIPQDAQGTVTCSYRLLTSNRARADRLDVRIIPESVIWGGAAEDFEEIRDDPERTRQ